jgi:hypothetical protein
VALSSSPSLKTPGSSLELMSLDVAPQQDLYTKQGVAVTVEAVAQIKSVRQGVHPNRGRAVHQIA